MELKNGFAVAVRSRASRSDAGVTLVEMLIALGLLGFILLGIAPLFLASVKSNYSANEYTSTHNLSRDKLEQLMNLPANHADLAPGPHSVNDLPATLPDPLTGAPGAVPNPFQRTYEVRHFVNPPEALVPTPNPQPTPFTATEVFGLALYDYKRIDVTVQTDAAHLGIGARRARVSGILSNPNSQASPVPTIPPTAVPPTPTP